jgi:hypothetical protein
MAKVNRLTKAQQFLWNNLTIQEKNKQLDTYQRAKSNLEAGIKETIINYGKTEIDAPAKCYFSIDDSLATQPNIVGEVKRCCDSLDSVVVFESKDIIALLELYYGTNILNI